MSTFLLGPFIETQSSKWLKIFKKKEKITSKNLSSNRENTGIQIQMHFDLQKFHILISLKRLE